MAFLRVIIFALACQTILATAADKPSSKNDERTIFIDGGSTDTAGDIVDVFLYFGTFTLAVLTALAIIGLIYGITESNGATGYASTGFDDYDSYSAYEKVYNVARSLYDGYQKYEAARDLKE